MRVFVLNVTNKPEGDELRCSHFQSLAKNEFDWRFDQFSVQQSRNDLKNFIPKVLDSLGNADAIVGFSPGFQFFFRYFHRCGEFYPLLLEKLRGRTPLYLEVIRPTESFWNGSPEHEDIVNLFYQLQILPTDHKIFNRLDSHSDNPWYSAWFRRADRCFINPDILGNRHDVLISMANVLEYGDDVYPVVELGPLHFLVDRGDNIVERNLSDRPAVFLESRSLSYALVVSGHLARDPFQTIGGEMTHGYDENESIVRNLITRITAKSDSRENRRENAFRLLVGIERRLGRLVQQILSEKLGRTDHSSIDAFFPEKVLDNLTKYSEGKPDYAQATFDDLTKILFHNWDDFAEIFGSTKSNLKRLLQTVNYRPRRYLAHPHRAECEDYDFNAEELSKIESVAGLVVAAEQKIMA
jgi:hypothetical protein